MADQPQFPPNFRDSVEDTRDLVNRLIDRAAAVAGATGAKWIDGFVRMDAQEVAEDAGAKFTEQVLDAWDTAEKNVKPAEK
ncbi:hypothetical protein [Mycolicibacterium palauense]|uniref:hypothetical protein n=1 Tax=Mycolicibacterium palauense TaxID=2034511 RepID=UPI000BFED39F|nr:hypothetical protein [Mycolicibacterium palauense]